MRDRSIIILLSAILVVGGFILGQEFLRSRNMRRDHEKLAVFNFHPHTLLSIQIAGTNGLIDCVKQDGSWSVGNPEQGMGRADPALVYKLIAELNALTRGTTISARQLDLRGISMSEYGFDAPVFAITAIDNQGRRSWKVGRNSPSGTDIYIQEVGSEDVFTVPVGLRSVLPSSPDDLRSRSIFFNEVAGIKRIEMRRSTGFLRIVRESGNWVIQQPIVSPADPYEIAAFLELLKAVRIEDFIDENVSDFAAYGLQGETRQISLGGVDGTSRTLVLGDPVPGSAGLIYARRADETSVFALKEDVLALLDTPVKQLRDARVLTLPKNEISSISIQFGEKRVALDWDPEAGWQIVVPAVWKADTQEIAELIDLWERVVITEYDVTESSDKASWVLEFGSISAGTTNRIEVLSAGVRFDGLLVRLNGESAVYQVNLPIVPDTIIDPFSYKDRLVWSLMTDDVRRIELKRSGKDAQILEKTKDGVFAAVESSGNGHVNASAVSRLLKCLKRIETPGYIAYNPRSLDTYGLEAPSLELYVGLAGGSELGRVLLVGHESSEGYYSMIKGRDVVFYLDKETVNILSSGLLTAPETSIQTAE
ncbi:MAG: DUF4340 domain-containing protein [Pontiellaceae bacterium]|nr:DUF4340 domain-containing protein [Pontiellaceae bacterium]MBN2784407.1 DUF4340 domain-containing protein [Pontiellaceae bacterium]